MPLRKFEIVSFIESFLKQVFIPLFRHMHVQITSWYRTDPSHQAVTCKRMISSKPSTLAQRLPAGAWDCHMHVTSPNYPLAPGAAYVPSLHNLQHAMDFEKSIGISNIVLVQPSIYGNDNSCLLDALKAIGPRHGRGVVGIDPNAVEATTLEAWHKLGVRGVRLNLKSVNAKYTEASLQNTLRHYADVIRPFNWILELYIGMEDLPILEEIAGDLGVRLCIAHFGSPTLPRTQEKRYRPNPYELAGFQSLINLLESGSTWVKFSAVYRFDNDPELLDTSAMATEILRKAGSRVVFASDWPHTRFDGLDVRPFVESCLEWAHEAGLADKVFSTNSRELWDATS